MDLAVAVVLLLSIVLTLPACADRRAQRLSRQLIARDLAELDAASARRRRVRHIYATYVA